MKMFLIISALSLVVSMKSIACSEAGPHDFDISQNVQTSCGKIALEYAKDFAQLMVKTEKEDKTYQGPDGKFHPSKVNPTLYTTQKRSGNSNIIGFNVGLDSKNKWACNFCVVMTLDEKGSCRIESINKHMCAQ